MFRNEKRNRQTNTLYLIRRVYLLPLMCAEEDEEEEEESSSLRREGTSYVGKGILYFLLEFNCNRQTDRQTESALLAHSSAFLRSKLGMGEWREAVTYFLPSLPASGNNFFEDVSLASVRDETPR